MANIYFSSDLTTKTKRCPTGFSFTYLIFGWIPLLLRGYWSGFIFNFVYFLLVNILFDYLGETSSIGSILFIWAIFLIIHIYISSIINGLYMSSLHSKGYKVDIDKTVEKTKMTHKGVIAELEKRGMNNEHWI